MEGDLCSKNEEMFRMYWEWERCSNNMGMLMGGGFLDSYELHPQKFYV